MVYNQTIQTRSHICLLILLDSPCIYSCESQSKSLGSKDVIPHLKVTSTVFNDGCTQHSN